jgi:hypothetical protein
MDLRGAPVEIRLSMGATFLDPDGEGRTERSPRTRRSRRADRRGGDDNPVVETPVIRILSWTEI